MTLPIPEELLRALRRFVQRDLDECNAVAMLPEVNPLSSLLAQIDDVLSTPPRYDPVTPWQPIETAPSVPGKYFHCRLAWGPDDDKCTSDGFRWNGRWFVAAVFHNESRRFDECQQEFRQIEVEPSHWQPKPESPAIRNLSTREVG